MTDWLTRRELAAHLKISLRQTYRVLMPFTGKGRARRYSREAVDLYMLANMETPERAKGDPGRPPLASMSVEEQIARQRARLRRRRH